MQDGTADDSRIPVMINIDVEPDEFLLDRSDPRPWKGFEFCNNYFRKLRTQFEELTEQSVHFNWMLRMDRQISMTYGKSNWVVDQYEKMIQEYQDHGDTIGLHVHTYRWSDEIDNWIEDCANSDWVDECVESSVEDYKQAFGQTCNTISFGNYWLSTAAVNHAESQGIEYDLTVEPGRLSRTGVAGRTQSGPSPDFCKVPRVPYYPSRKDFRLKDPGPSSRSILLIPMTSSYLKLGGGYNGNKARIGRLLRNGIKGRLQSTTLAMVRNWEGENCFSNMLDRAIEVQNEPYLSFTIRSNIHDKRLERIDKSMTALLNNSEVSRFKLSTPQEAIELLRVQRSNH